jgi:LmbE family N-acetylglucosaminyl deacetylase
MPMPKRRVSAGKDVGFMSEKLILGEGTSLHAWDHSTHLAQLPVISAEILVPVSSRAVIVAPHPDDQVVGFGGLMQQLGQLGRTMQLISIIDGDPSQPGSTTWPTERVAAVRPQASSEALQRLDLPLDSVQWVRGGFSDSAVAREEQALSLFIEYQLRPTDVVFVTWELDGRSDNEAVGRAALQAARNAGAQCYQVPLWTWHWAQPEDESIPWQRARKILLDPMTIARKRHAADAFANPLQGDPDISLSPVLTATVSERLLQPFEVVFL